MTDKEAAVIEAAMAVVSPHCDLGHEMSRLRKAVNAYTAAPEPAKPCRRSETGWCWTHDKMCEPAPSLPKEQPCLRQDPHACRIEEP